MDADADLRCTDVDRMVYALNYGDLLDTVELGCYEQDGDGMGVADTVLDDDCGDHHVEVVDGDRE
jgi:hypothetical protein